MMNKKFVTVTLSLLSICTSIAHASAPDLTANRPPGLLSAVEINVIAKEAVAQETDGLNAALAASDGQSVYSPKLLKKFESETGKDRIDLAEVYDKCVYTPSDLLNIASSTLTTGNDRTTSRTRELQNVRVLYGKNTWTLFSRACKNAQSRFESRIASATSNGTPVNFKQEEVQALSQIIFFPTIAGSIPSKKKQVYDLLFNTAVSGGLVFGPISALSGIAIGGDFVMVSTAAGSGEGMLSQITSAFQKTPSQKLQKLIEKSPEDVKIDLTSDEQAIADLLN